MRNAKQLKIALTESLILANLKPEDAHHFHAAEIGFSGSTGAYAKGYGGLAPYIATFLCELPRTIIALEWQHFSVTKHLGSWIVRRVVKREKQP
jgi:hypothetical protein